MTKVIRWILAPIVGFVLSIIAGALVVYFGEAMGPWVPFSYAVGGFVSALVFVVSVYKIAPTHDVEVVKFSSLSIGCVGILSVIGSLIGDPESIGVGIGIVIAAFGLVLMPDTVARLGDKLTLRRN